MKHIRERSFMINGLTAKWGIGENRVPPIWDANLVGYWDARDLPNGEVDTVANKARLATKAPYLAVNGATMVDGTLQFDGVNARAQTNAFQVPRDFTLMFDIDWLGDADTFGGVIIPSTVAVTNKKSTDELNIIMGQGSGTATVPNTIVGVSTNNKAYLRDGTTIDLGLNVNFGREARQLLLAYYAGTNYTQLGFRQLLIFNKELSPTEVNEVLTTMFPV